MNETSTIKTLVNKHHHVVFLACLALLVLIVYRHSLFVYFLSDDFSIIGKFLERKTFYFSFSDYFRPIPLIDLWLDTQLFGLKPWLFRLSSFVLHTLNAFLVYRLALLLLENKQQHLAYISGILFAILACHSEAVIWIACRPDLLATLFCLVCLITYLMWLRSNNNTLLFVSGLAFLLAFLSKESAYALPFLLIVITCFHESPLTAFSNIKKYHLALLLFSLGLLLQSSLRFMATHALLGGEDSLFSTTTPYLYNLFVYSYRTFLFPTNTTLEAENIAHSFPVAAMIAILIIALGLWKSDTRSRKIALFMLAAFIAALLPVLHKTMSLFDVRMERYLYLPSVFICIFIPIFLGTIRVKSVWQLILAIYIIAMVAFLDNTIVRWNKASEITMNSLQEIKEHFHSEKLVVIGLPFSYKGVHIFQNGFPRAVMFFNEVPIRRKNIYMPITMEINNDNANIVLNRNATEFHATLDGISVLSAGDEIGAYKLVKHQDNDISVQYAGINNNDYQLMLYCDGQLRFLENCGVH